jgi:hypothetical protein
VGQKKRRRGEREREKYKKKEKKKRKRQSNCHFNQPYLSGFCSCVCGCFESTERKRSCYYKYDWLQWNTLYTVASRSSYIYTCRELTNPIWRTGSTTSI